jgi:hypothetical protein
MEVVEAIVEADAHRQSKAVARHPRIRRRITRFPVGTPARPLLVGDR